MDLDKVKEILESDYGYSNLKEENEYSLFINGILKDTIEIIKLNYMQSCEMLPTKYEVISEGEKQIIDWLKGNTDREKEHYRVAFRRSFEYVQRRLRK